MSREVSKVTLLHQLDRIEWVIQKIRRKAHRGFFGYRVISPLFTELRKAIEGSSLPPEALNHYKKMKRKVDRMLADAPVVMEDFKFDLCGVRDYWGDAKITTPRSIAEFVVVRRREILSIDTETDLPDLDQSEPIP